MTASRWVQYTEALPRVLGCTTDLLIDATWTYRLLLMPTFHPTSCLALSGNLEEGVMIFTLLDDSVADLFHAIWQQDEAQLANPELWRQRHCFSDLVLLSAAECERVVAHMHSIQPWQLSDVHLAERDGIAIRVDCASQEGQHTVHMTSPDRVHTPHHHALLAYFLRLWQSYFAVAPLQQYFAVLQNYLPDISLSPSIS